MAGNWKRFNKSCSDRVCVKQQLQPNDPELYSIYHISNKTYSFLIPSKIRGLTRDLNKAQSSIKTSFMYFQLSLLNILPGSYLFFLLFVSIFGFICTFFIVLYYKNMLKKQKFFSSTEISWVIRIVVFVSFISVLVKNSRKVLVKRWAAAFWML